MGRYYYLIAKSKQTVENAPNRTFKALKNFIKRRRILFKEIRKLNTDIIYIQYFKNTL